MSFLSIVLFRGFARIRIQKRFFGIHKDRRDSSAMCLGEP